MSDMVLELDPALEQIIAFGEQFSASHLVLAMHAALPVGLTPELLHLLRVNFVKSAPAIAEADLLLSPLCREVYGEWYEFHPAERDHLLQELRTDPRFGARRVEEIAHFVYEYTRRLLADATWRSANLHTMLVAQRWSALAYAAPELAAQTLVAELNEALLGGNPRQAVPIARLASALAEPLMGEDRALVYAIGVSKLLSGDRETALSLLETLGTADQMQSIGASRPLTPAELLTLIPAEQIPQVIPGTPAQAVPDEEAVIEAQPEAENISGLHTESVETETLPPATPPPAPAAGLKQIRLLRGHSEPINRMAWSPDHRLLATASYDHTVRLWNMTTKDAPLVLRGPTNWVSGAAWSADGRLLAAGSGDGKIWLWEAATGQIINAFKANTRTIFSVAWSPDGKLLASASGDTNVMLWDTRTFKSLGRLQGHSGAVYGAAWSPNGRDLASCSEDGTVRIWDDKTGRLKRILEGHTEPVYALDWSPDGRILASASADMTIRLWGQQVGVLEGHTSVVTDVSFSFDGRLLASKSLDGTVRLWQTDTWDLVSILPEKASSYWTAGLAFHPRRPVLATQANDGTAVRVWRYDENLITVKPDQPTITYSSAKVVLVGDSGVGKTSLADALTGRPLQPTVATHGRRVQPFDSQENILGTGDREIREIYLWDLAGQPDYRLLHQLDLDQVNVALVVFDSSREIEPFASVRYWARALRHAQQLKGGDWPLKIFLVAGRIDRGGVGVSQEGIETELQQSHFDGYFETSAMHFRGVSELEAAIRSAVDWNALPKVRSTGLFQTIRLFLRDIRESGRLLHTVDELYDTFLATRDAPDETPDLRAQFEACIGLLESQGFIRRFTFGSLVLLQPDILYVYTSAMINAAREEADGAGSIAEEDVFNGRFRVPEEERVADRETERLLLFATVEDLIRYEIALRDEDVNGVSLLVFPSQVVRVAPDMPEPDSRTAIFTFEGPVLNIYTSLVVRLWSSRLFASKDVFENATFFYETEGVACRVYLRSLEEGLAELSVFFDESLTNQTRSYVEEYVQAHLMRRALPGSVQRKRLIICETCGTLQSEQAVSKRLELGYDFIHCPVCESRISLKPKTPTTAQSLLRQAMVTRIDREADSQRERQMARSVIQGKRATGDYDIFLCHNRPDKPAVKHIGEQLQEYGILPWLDEWELPPGQPWQAMVEKQIMESKMMAFFVGSGGIGAWQEQELSMFMDLKRPIILVFLPDAPQNARLPASLRGATWVDFRKSDPDPTEQLVWGITGKQPRRSQ